MDRILFFTLMPIIFELIMCFIYCFPYNLDESIGKEIKLFIVLLIVDYIIEFIYLIIIRNILGVWIFSEEFNCIKTYDTYSNFVIFSIVLIIVKICLSLTNRDMFYNYELPIANTIILIICFTVFSIMESFSIHEFQDNDIFNSMSYQTKEDTIYIKSIRDGKEISGSIYGRKRFGAGCIQGEIETNYNLYYAFVDDNGKTVIKSIPYNENNVNIYEIDDKEKPRIVLHKYYKSYSCEKGHNKYDEYYIYDIFVPSISNYICIDME